MKKLLLLPILLFAFNATAMEHLEEAEKLFKKSKASKAKKPEKDSCADAREGRLDAKEKEVDYTWQSDLNEEEWNERYGCKYCPKDGCETYGYKYWPEYARKDSDVRSSQSTEEFDCKKLLENPSWQEVLRMPQGKKDGVLSDMVMEQSGHPRHYWRHGRCHIAAAVCAGANPNTKTKETFWKRPLRNIVYRDPPMTKLLLEHGADPKLKISRDYSGNHPAICEARTLKEAKLLLDHGASPHVQCGYYAPSLLHKIILYNQGEAPQWIDLYLRKGVDPNKQKPGVLGGTPLHRLADPVWFFKPEDIRRMGKSLIQYGADVDAKDKWDETAEDILLRRKMNECSEFENRRSDIRRNCDGIDALLEVIREAKEKQSKG